MQKKFLRRDAKRFSKFGKGRGKKAKWRNQSGRHNKIREGKKGYPAAPSIGYGTPKSENLVAVSNAKELEAAKGKKIIIASVGKKKKMEIARKASEMKIEIENMNAKSFVKRTEKKNALKKKKTPAAKTEPDKEIKKGAEDGKK